MARPRGRRSGDPAVTRREILDAARRCFAGSGYDRSTMRSIAADAGVDPSLVVHYFGSKRGLFAAAHEIPVDPSEVLARVADLPTELRGLHLTREFLEAFASPDSPALSLLRVASTDERVAETLRAFLTETVVRWAPRIAPGHGGEDRLVLALTQLIGVVVARSVIGLTSLTSQSIDDLVEIVAPQVERCLVNATRAGE